jgi:hypothetical protein
MAAKKKSSSAKPGKSALRTVAGAATTDTLLDLVERLGVVDLVLGRVRSRIEETDLDELLDEVVSYMKRNPEVLVATLGGATIATALLVWMNNRREWDGSERRGTSKSRSRNDDEDEDVEIEVEEPKVSTGRVRRVS